MKIRRELLRALIEIARENHPHEFFALLTGKKGVIEEFVYIPFQQGEDYASFNTSLIPLGMRIYGTVHSHPSSNPRPSPQDLSTFSSYGRVHLIVHYPYCENCWKAYDPAGNETDLEVV
ncbi:Mov34/MPN/PAD-1 family protein [Geoglobus sp.]